MLNYKAMFPRACETCYLDTGAEGLPAPHTEEALLEYCRAKASGTPGRRHLYAVAEETRELAARLLGAPPSSVAFMSHTSAALNILSSSLDWQAGDEVVISDLEFPSNVLPWLRLKQAGVRLIVVPGERGCVAWERIAERISTRTRLVSLSLVSYKTGAYLHSIPQLAAEARRVGAILSIDATQALGRCPVSLEGVDYLMASSYKWLLAPHGLAVVYLSPALRERLQPAGVGWYSVANIFTPERFERYELKPGAECLTGGMPNFTSIYGMREALRFLLDAGVQRISEDLSPLVHRLREGLSGMGLELLTPAGAEYASGIVSFAHPQAETLGVALERSGVVVWAGDGRVRASLHLYNDAGDVDRYLDRLCGLLRGGGIADA